MRPAPSPASSPADRTGDRAKRTTILDRKARLRRLALETLEERALMAGLPAPLATGATVDISNPNNNLTGNESAPSIAIDPANPQKMVAVWTRHDPGNLGGINGTSIQSVIRGAVSTNGGASWTSFSPETFP